MVNLEDSKANEDCYSVYGWVDSTPGSSVFMLEALYQLLHLDNYQKHKTLVWVCPFAKSQVLVQLRDIGVSIDIFLAIRTPPPLRGMETPTCGMWSGPFANPWNETASLKPPHGFSQFLSKLLQLTAFQTPVSHVELCLSK